jgi:transposase
MPKRKSSSQKIDALRHQGTLYLHPDRVSDELFQENDFFDPHDLVQVKYEMLRRVQVDKRPVIQTAACFGFSRPTFYQAQLNFEQDGLAGLIRERPGPRKAHKFTSEVLDFIVQEKEADSSLLTRDLVQRVRDRFGIIVHRNSIDRALRRREKKRQ